MSQCPKTLLLLQILLIFMLSSCSQKKDDSQTPDLNQWGISSSSKELSGNQQCDASSDLCWPSQDTKVMKEIIELESQIVLEQNPAKNFNSLLSKYLILKHKLNDKELQALELIIQENQSLSLPKDLDGQELNNIYLEKLTRLRNEVSSRVIGNYRLAYTIPVGKIMSASEMENKLDKAREEFLSALKGNVSEIKGDISNHQESKEENIKKNLTLLRHSGAYGKVVAFMLEQSGVLDEDYSPYVVNENNFEEIDTVDGTFVPRGLSREYRTDKIIKDYARLAGFVGITTGAEAMIPFAGIPISVLHETFEIFRLHAKMTFEIAAVHGWNIYHGRNLSRMVLIMISYGNMAEVTDILFSNIIVPMVLKSVAQRFGFSFSMEFFKQFAIRSYTQIAKLFSRKAQEATIEAVVTNGAKGTLQSLAGWASLGAAVLVSGAIDYGITIFYGRHVRFLSKKWLFDLMLEGTTYLAQKPKRDCLFACLAAFVRADGMISSKEERLFQAFLAKPYYINESHWMRLSREERVFQSRRLQNSSALYDYQARQVISCAKSKFAKANSQHRIALLSNLFAMMHIDSGDNAAEREIYDTILEAIDSRGWFGSNRLNLHHLAYMEKAILMIVNPSNLEGTDTDYHRLLQGIIPAETIDYMINPDPEVVEDYLKGSSAQK